MLKKLPGLFHSVTLNQVTVKVRFGAMPAVA